MTEQQNSPERNVTVGAVTDGYRVQRIVSVRAGRHTLAEATSPDGERVLLQLCEDQPAEKGVRRRAARLAKTRRSIAHGHLLPLMGYHTPGRDLCWGGVPPDAVTLAEKLKEGKRLDPAWVIAVVSQAAGALETARQGGLVPHRLTPADILVAGTDPPRALIADVGIDVPDVPACKYRASIEDADYLSPEEIRGESPTPESSVYSLACILVHCLTGAPPFELDRPLLTLHAHRVEQPPRLSERDAQLPAALDEVIGRAMSKDPRRRHQTPMAFMRAVQDALRIRAPIPVRGRGASRTDLHPIPVVPPPHVGRPRSGRPASAAPSRPPEKSPAPQGERPPRDRPPEKRRPQPKPAERRERPERQKQREHPNVGRKRLRMPRRAISWASLALVTSALAGFMAGTGGSDRPPASATPARATPPAQTSRATSRATVSPVVRRLQSRRVALRRQLREARSAPEQLEAVRDLESAYRHAQVALGREPGMDSLGKSLVTSLGAVAGAYHELAAAAAEPNPEAWLKARAAVRERERDLELLLRSSSWT
jgi:serine/threonine protein kinase